MDFEKTLDSDLGAGLSINSESKGYLAETAKWAKFLAIIGFFFMAIIIIGAISMAFVMGSEFDDLFPGMGIMIVLLYILMAGIYIFPILYLYRFATNMKGAINSNDNMLATEAFSNLKSHYKFFGILMAIFLGIYAFIFIMTFILGAGSFIF